MDCDRFRAQTPSNAAGRALLSRTLRLRAAFGIASVRGSCGHRPNARAAPRGAEDRAWFTRGQRCSLPPAGASGGAAGARVGSADASRSGSRSALRLEAYTGPALPLIAPAVHTGGTMNDARKWGGLLSALAMLTACGGSTTPASPGQTNGPQVPQIASFAASPAR